MKEALKFIEYKDGKFIFEKANIADIIIEWSGFGIIARVFNVKGATKGLIWVSNSYFEYMKKQLAKEQSSGDKI